MEHQGLLIGLSQIGVIYAGLISVFIIFAAQEGRFPAHEKQHVLGLVSSCIGLLFGSLSPFAFHLYRLEGDLLWRWTAALGLIWGTTLTMIAFVRYLRLSREDKQKNGYFNALFTFGMTAVIAVLFAASALGYAPAANYIMGVLLLVPVGMSSFVAFAQQRFIGKV